MLPTQVIASHFCCLSPDVLSVMLELRNIIGKIAPNAVEEIRRQGLVYYDAARGGPVSAGICQILIEDGSLRLSFIHGAFLPDPSGLLVDQGGRLAKRDLPLPGYDCVPWKEVEELILASSRFDPYSFYKLKGGA